MDWSKEIRLRCMYIKEHGEVPNNNRITQKTLEDFFLLNPNQKNAYKQALKNLLEK